MAYVGIEEIDAFERREHQVFVAGSDASYFITVIIIDNDGVEHERTPSNNVINGASGTPLLLTGKIKAFKITPPDANPYTVDIS